MFPTKMTILVALGLVMPAFNCSAGLFGPSNFDECVIKGRPANIHYYTVFDFVNSTVQGFVPSNMAKDVVGRLITEHLDSIKRLCPLD